MPANGRKSCLIPVPAQLPTSLGVSLLVATLAGTMSLAPPASPADIAVDPAGGELREFASLGEWNVEGDLEGWTVDQASGAAASGGALSGSDDGVSPVDPKVQLLGKAGGPDLDLGYNDYLEFRLSVPAEYSGDIQIYWGTTSLPGISDERSLTIPSTLLPGDGWYHVYRIDMGLEPSWRGSLRDLRIDPLNGPEGSGLPFAIDHVRVGDAGPDYLSNYLYYAPGTAGVNDMVSKHFRVVWGTNDEITMSWGNFNTNAAAIARGNLRNMEDQWQVYTKVLGYREPSESVHEAKRDGNRYKVNLFVGRTGLSRHAGGGYFLGYDGDSGFGWLTIDTSGLRFDPPSWVNPHELGHVFQVHQEGYNDNSYMGFWWECHANWFREGYLRSPLYPEAGKSGFGSAFPRNAHLFHGHGRHYYDHWPIWSYLEENPDGLPFLGSGFTARLWQEALPGEYIYDQLARMCPGLSVKDLLSYYVRRNVTWDYAGQKAIWGALGVDGSLAYSGSYLRLAFAELVQRPDDPTWWQVPLEFAPMQGAYNIIELVPEGTGGGRLVTLDFRGLSIPGRDADWRACLVAVDGAGAARYGVPWNSGDGAMTLTASETRLFLAVVATPAEFIPQEASEQKYPYANHPARARFPYEVQVSGAVPMESRPSSEGQAGAAHPRGGGFVARSAAVDATAYVGPNAKVLDSAQVRGNARIEDFAVVEDTAQVRDDAVVSGHARVRGNARVLGSAKVRDYGEVRDSAQVIDHGRVLEHGTAAETLVVSGHGVVKGFAYAWDDPDGGQVSGNGICDGDYAAGHSVADAVLCGWLISSSYAASRAGTLPDGLYAGYEFHRQHPSLAEDAFGVTHGYLRGDPDWVEAEDGHEGAVLLDGASQYAVLPRSVSDLDDITLAAWVRWGGGAADQRIFELGSSSSKLMYLTPKSARGRLELVGRDGATDQRIDAAPLSDESWKHVVVTLDGDVGTLYVDGVLVGTGAFTIDPEDLNAPNTNATPQANYLGRGQEGNYFSGLVDSFRVYSKALSAEEVAELSYPPPIALLRKGSIWKYLDTGENPGASWKSLGFNDAAWPSGPAQLGFGDGDEATVVRNRGQITTYFRRSFELESADAVKSLEIRLLRDDGAVAYVNGAEVFRSNMPAGTIAASTLASTRVADEGDETVNFYSAVLDPELLVSGQNVVAVEVHQADAASSDLSFDLELVAVLGGGARPHFHRGDPDGTGMADISDALFVLSFLFLEGSAPACLESADVNNDGGIDIADCIRILFWLFTGGPEPGAPGPVSLPCGSDPDPPGSPGDLGCSSYPPCG